MTDAFVLQYLNMHKIFKNVNKTLRRELVGITTVGEKGQIVIPAELRKAMKLAKGEKLVVVKADNNAVILAKASQFEAFTAQLMKRLVSVQKLIKK
jgi:AbrB family looped-hinge helix DNA binding protein